MRLLLVPVAALLAAAAVAWELDAPRAAPSTPAPPVEAAGPPLAPPAELPAPPEPPPIHWRKSRALGKPSGGRLAKGVQLPEHGRDFVTWDPIRDSVPNRGWRRWGTDRLVRVLLQVAREHREANPDAPPLLVGDLSRKHGGDFGPRYGPPGHRSHQNGLDLDVYYPRTDRQPVSPSSPADIDRELAQDLVDRFARAGAKYVFVGPATGLKGRRGVVRPLVKHDDHLHFRLAQ